MVLAEGINLLNKAYSFKMINWNELRESAKLNEQPSLLLILVKAVCEYEAWQELIKQSSQRLWAL